jgi:hypothetical protein
MSGRSETCRRLDTISQSTPFVMMLQTTFEPRSSRVCSTVAVMTDLPSIDRRRLSTLDEV